MQACTTIQSYLRMSNSIQGAALCNCALITGAALFRAKATPLKGTALVAALITHYRAGLNTKIKNQKKSVNRVLFKNFEIAITRMTVDRILTILK